MSEIKKCPKCGGEMEKGKRMFIYGGVFRLTKKGDVVGDKVSPFYCKKCGYIEFYKESQKKRK